MPTLLLITEQESVRRLFAELERSGLFGLRVAPTLAQGEEELAARTPDCIFVQNHLSGLAGILILRFLRGLVPDDTAIILMARDGADAADAKESGVVADAVLDLSLPDHALRRSIEDALPVEAAAPTNPPPVEPAPAAQQSARELLFDEPDRKGPAARERRLLWLIPVLLAVVALSVLAYRAGKKGPQPPAPTRAVAPPATGTPLAQNPAAPNHLPEGSGSESKKVLPPFIAEGVADPAYSQSHPGWERYSYPDCEFRLYRENLAIKALQVMASPGKMLLPALLNLALREVAGIESYRVVAREQTADFTVERGAGSGGLKLTLYRSKKGGGLQAFVLENQATGTGPSFDLDPAQLPGQVQAVPAQPAPAGTGKQAPARNTATAGKKGAASQRYRYYTVQKGDSLQKILVRDFGFSAKAADEMLPEVQ